MKESDIEIIRRGIRESIIRMKAEKTIGCSFDNLKQLSRTSGISCTKPEYNSAFFLLSKQEAENLSFELYE